MDHTMGRRALVKHELGLKKTKVVDRATKRVIAPFVKIVRKKIGKPEEPEEPQEENKQFSYYLHKKPSALMRDFASYLCDSVDLPSLLSETAEVLKGVTRSTGVALYMVDDAQKEIYQFQKSEINIRHKVNWKIMEGTTVAAFVAHHKEFIMVDDIIGDERFLDGIGYKDETVKSVLCVPIVTPDSDCLAVMELYRDVTLESFNKDDLKIVIAVTGWMGAALHQNQQRVALQRQQELNEYLLNLTKCYFADTVIMEKMLSEIVAFAKLTLGAERGSFFIIDKESDELVADFFDEGIGGGSTFHKKNMKIRIGKDTGIAGLVANTGESVNIKDAYNDARFNKEIDRKTGFITRSILCMPIMGVDGILGVVQLVNKKTGTCFTNQDENLFKTFSVYCALALHYSNLHILIRKTDKLNKCYYRLLQYHIKPTKHDFNDFIFGKDIKELPENFDEFNWYITPELEPMIVQFSLYVITYIIGPEKLDREALVEFVLSCKNCYRLNPYHNFFHAFNVCHCMYNILKRNMEYFNECEKEALMIATLCHDLDHPGFSNNFLGMTNDVFVQLYEDSPLENHHFDMALLLLSNSQIFKSKTQEEYKLFISEMKDAIIATDLANYFKARTMLMQAINENDEFNWANPEHRTLLKAIAMTSCDLSGQCKPFPIAKKITDSVYDEFYHQGDLEKTMDLVPLSMMDRTKQYLVPEDQVQFLSVVVMPCTELLKIVLPNTEPLYNECRILRDTWKEIINLRGLRTWRQDSSIVRRESSVK